MSKTKQEEAIAVVLSFIQQMNDWEHKRYLLSRLASGQPLNHASDRAIVPDMPVEIFHQEYFRIFEAHCTTRKRVHGGNAGSWARNGKYAGASSQTIESVEETKPGRIEVVLRGGQFHGNRFLFVVLKTAAGWRIDSAKHGQPGHWRIHYL